MIQAYGGVDYQAHNDDGRHYQVGGIGFVNPNNVPLAGFWAPFDNATSAPVVGLTADIDFEIGDVTLGLIVS